MAKPLTKELLTQKVQENLDYVKGIRRWMHENPEVSGKEFDTSAMILKEIEATGLPYEKAATNGYVVTMKCGRPGKTLALRADIDALPVPEDEKNLKNPKGCISKREGASHACGHDAHTAMMLGAMKILNEVKDQLAGTILFCFEEGEEIGTGIMGMLEVLDKKQIDGCWGIHVYYALDSGKISVDGGPRMAGANSLKIAYKGKGGHGSRPDQAINPILAVNQCISGLSTAWSSRIDVTKTVTLGFGRLWGGNQGNIIPEEAGVDGTIRFFDMEEGAKAAQLVHTVAEAAAAATGCEVTTLNCKLGVSSCINNDACAALAQKALNEVLEPGVVASCDPWFASESFSYYLSRWPGVLAFLGIRNEEKGTGALHHNPKFEIDEDVLGIGMTSTVQYAQAFLED